MAINDLLTASLCLVNESEILEAGLLNLESKLIH